MIMLDFFFQKLCVKSELICKKCCKHITDFHSFHVSILKIQDGAVTRKIKNIIPVPSPKPAPAATIKRAETLFTVCAPDTFTCNMCKATLVGKELLNKHLYAQHKVKINCKLCKTRYVLLVSSQHEMNNVIFQLHSGRIRRAPENVRAVQTCSSRQPNRCGTE